MTRFSRRSVIGSGIAGAIVAGLPRRAARAQGEASPAASMQDRIEIDADARRQTLDGFGVSGVRWAQEIGGWDDANRRRVVELRFDRQRGIGLSIYRYNVGAGGGSEISDPWRRAEMYEVAPGVYGWSRDRNAVWMLKAAKAAGVERLVAFANSPRAWPSPVSPEAPATAVRICVLPCTRRSPAT